MGDIGKGIRELIVFLTIVAVVAVPLAIWKFVDMAIWVAHHL